MAKPKTPPKEDFSAFDAPPEDFSAFNEAPSAAPEVLLSPEGGKAALSSFGDAASLGYLPQLRAMAEPLTDRAFKAVTGADVEPAPLSQVIPMGPDYIASRDQASKEIAKQRQDQPVASLLGGLAGSVATAPLLGGTAGAATKLGRIGQAVKGGAIAGLLQNPGDVEGAVSPLQLGERAQGAVQGGLLGGAAGTTGEALGAAGKALGSIPAKLEQYGQTKAFKSSGAMLKDFRKAFDKGKVEELGQEMIDSGLVKPGSTFEDVASQGAELKKQVGTRIGEIYDQVKSKIGDTATVNTDQAYSDLIDAISNPKVRPKLGAKAYDDRMLTEIEDIVKNKDQLTNPKFLNEVIGELDQKINYAKRANELPVYQEGFLELRRALRKQLNDTVELVGKEAGNPELANELKALNKRYGNLSEISTIAKDRVSRENANRMFGLTDTILASGGAAGGFASSGDGHGVEGALKGAALGAALGGANKLARTYGNPLVATGATRLGQALQNVPSPVSQGLLNAGKAVSSDPTRAGALSQLLFDQRLKDKRKGLLK